MENLILLAHLVIALAIIGLILMQQGKGAEMGASFGGGSSQTLFGSTGSGNFFAKLTALCAALFFATSFSLAVIAKNKSTVDEIQIPGLEEVDIPVLEEAAAVVEDIPTLEEVSVPSEEELPVAPVEE